MPVAVIKATLRLTCDQAQAPGGLADALGGPVKFWRGNPVRLQLLLNSNGDIVDIDQFASIRVEVFASQAENLAPLMSATVAAGATGWDSGCTADEWTDRTSAHAYVDFSAAETLLDLDGETSADFWIVVSVAPLADTAQRVTFGGGTLTVHEDATPGSASGAIQPGTVIPNGATYNGSGAYTLAVTAGRVYQWEPGANDTNLVNGTITLTASGATTALGSSVVLHGTPSAAITATVRVGGFYTADDVESMFARVTAGSTDPNGAVTGKAGDLYRQKSGDAFQMWYCDGDGAGGRGTVWL